MKAFRILLALAVAGATFYSLNALAVQNGYRDRLDFKNKHYHEHHCVDRNRSEGFSSRHRRTVDTSVTAIDSTNNLKR